MSDKIFGGKMFHAQEARTQRNISKWDIDLGAGLVDFRLPAAGSLLYIDRVSTGYASVELNQEAGGSLDPLTMMAGDSVECPFQSLKFNAPAQVGKTLRVLICNGVAIRGGSGVSTGATNIVVNTVDGGLARTLANQAFMCYSAVGGVIAQYSHTQLFNTVGSGKNLYVESMTISSDTAGDVRLVGYSAKLSGAGVAAMNKYGGSAAGVGVSANQNNATQIYATLGPVFAVSVNAPLILNFREPLLVPAGRGIGFTHDTQNVKLTANFEWYEQ